MENNTSSSHSHLYAAIIVLLIIAALYFIYQPASPPNPDLVPGSGIPLVNQKVTLTPDQIAMKEKALVNPELSQKVTLTKKQIEAKKVALSGK